MDGIAAAFFGNGDDLLDVQIGGNTGAFEGDGLFRLSGMERARVILGKHRHRPYVQISRRPHDADGDFPSIGNKQFHLVSHPPFLKSPRRRIPHGFVQCTI